MNEIEAWIKRIDEYETAHERVHENPECQLIFLMFQNEIKRLYNETKNSSRSSFDKKMLFVKLCVLRQMYDDLLNIPEAIRPWTSSESRWLQEMQERENHAKVKE